MPKLSIITVNLNNSVGLRKTFDSIFEQTFKDFEQIVIDGGSTDGSSELIKANVDKISYWVSEKDSGIYNAMNKGIVKSTGDYLLFLNSGDHLLHKNILQEVSYNMDGTDIIYGDFFLIESETNSWTGGHPDSLSFNFFVECTLPHSASFIKRSLFEQVGFYDEELLICSDWKFFLDAICRHNASYKHIDKTISVFYLDGISSSASSIEIIKKEKNLVLQRDYPIFMQMNDELTRLKRMKHSKLKKVFKRVSNKLGRLLAVNKK